MTVGDRLELAHSGEDIPEFREAWIQNLDIHPDQRGTEWTEFDEMNLRTQFDESRMNEDALIQLL